MWHLVCGNAQYRLPMRNGGLAKCSILLVWRTWPKVCQNQLSGGQQQRIALARTIIVEPEVLPLDQPLSNLDGGLCVKMRRELLRLQRQLGLTTIFVTHDQKNNTTSDRMAVLDGGVIQQVESPQEFYDRPSNLFVANFLGTANILKGEVEIDGD